MGVWWVIDGKWARIHLTHQPFLIGNYVFDYRDRKFHIGAIMQAMMIGDEKTDLPMMGYFKFDTEALGRFTSQIGVRSFLCFTETLK